MSQSSRGSFSSGHFGASGSRYSDLDRVGSAPDSRKSGLSSSSSDQFSGMKRHQLWDAPVPRPGGDADSERISMTSQPSQMTGRKQTIKFDEQDVVHSYHPTGTGDDSAIHEHRLRNQLSPGRSPPVGTDNAGTSTLTGSDSMRQHHTTSSPPRLPTVVDLDPALDPDMEKGLHSAPPRLSLGIDRNGPPTSIDPFAGSPSTTTLSSFPSASTPSPSEEERITPQHRRFGRSSGSSSRVYPRDRLADPEERVRLWGPPRSDSEDGEEPSPPIGGIRLVPNSQTTRF